MASSVIKRQSQVHMIKGTYATNSGYIVIVNNLIKTTSKVFVQILRSNNEWQRYMAYPRIDANGSVLIFLRDYNGTPPNDGSTFDICVLFGE